MPDFELSTRELDDFARDLKAAGKDVQTELYRGLNSVTKDLRAELKASALETLPKRGGLAALVAGASITARIRRGSTFGVRLQVRDRRGKSFNAAGLDAGLNEHPTYNHKPTVKQSVPAGWFTKPWEKFGADAQKAMLQVVDNIRARIRRG